MAARSETLALSDAPHRRDWQTRPYPYAVLNQNVADALRDFGYNLGIRVMLGPDVSGTIDGRMPTGTALEFLNSVTKGNELDWYFDGTVLYVSKSSAERTEVVPLNGRSFDDVKKSLEQDGLLDLRFHVAQQAGGDAAVIAGPPSFVVVIRQAIEARTSGRSPSGVPRSGMAILRGSGSTGSSAP